MSENKQTQANLRWAEKNKERKKYLNYRTMSRSFIKNLATNEDLDELESLINTRRKEVEAFE